MVIELILGVLIATISGFLGFFLANRANKANYLIYEEEAKARAEVIDDESKRKLKEANLEIKNMEIKAKESLGKERTRLQKEYNISFEALKKKEYNLNSLLDKELSKIKKERREIKALQSNLDSMKVLANSTKESYESKLEELFNLLENISGLTKDEAKNLLFDKLESLYRGDISHMVRKNYQLTSSEFKKEANFILSQAVTRYAGEFAAERLINMISLTDEDLKGRIIGKEGRNIKALELKLGVDIIIDDTPNVIIVSSFNLYRRAIATKTLELLIEDGRIQPSRIEDIYNKVSQEFEDSIYEDGEETVFDLGLSGLNPELIKLVGKLRYRASYGQNALGHSLEVAYLAGIMAAEMGGDPILARRAGLLHDIGKSLTHEYSGTHVELGAEVCKRYKESDVVINAIYAHHEHEEPKSIEAAAVCAADTISAARPGARREVLESFLKRVQEIENIAYSKNGVYQAYAINAGRELRVFVKAELINDDEASLLALEIAKDIENSVQYPGKIKVNVIRELRAIEYAK
jgi:ribonuclease Y